MIKLIYISIYVLISFQDKEQINKILNDLHKYASQANGKLYFDLFHEDAIFFGTDAKERWTKQEFENYALERFNKGDGWTYYSISRNVYLNNDLNTAWFDEELKNEKYGVFRGTGVLTKVDDKWKINQYNLLLPIPNDLLIKYYKEIIEFLNNDN